MDLRHFAAAFCLGAAALAGCGGNGEEAVETPRRVAATREPADPSANPGGGRALGTGVVRGRVLYGGPVPERRPLTIVKDVAVCRKIDHLDDRLVVGEGGGIRHAVVSLKGVPGGKALQAPPGGFVLDQKSCAYLPHVLLLPVGVPLTILNSDGVLHNVHTYSRLNPPFNIAQPKTVRALERSFAVPERIGVRCDVHGWMSAWVVVVSDAYHAVTDGEGWFEITGVPPGRYEAECWQESLGMLTAEVVVGADGGTETEFRYLGES